MIDCHVITLPDSNPVWLEECLASIQHPGVTVHRVDGVVGNIGFGRAAGFSKGAKPFVTFIDPDDWAEPEAFDRIMANLGDTGLCTAETIRAPGGKAIIRGIEGDSDVNHGNHFKPHHFLVLPRAAVMPHIKALRHQTWMPETWLMGQITQSISLPFLDEPLYNWRIHDGQGHSQFRIY